MHYKTVNRYLLSKRVYKYLQYKCSKVGIPNENLSTAQINFEHCWLIRLKLKVKSNLIILNELTHSRIRCSKLGACDKIKIDNFQTQSCYSVAIASHYFRIRVKPSIYHSLLKTHLYGMHKILLWPYISQNYTIEQMNNPISGLHAKTSSMTYLVWHVRFTVMI